MFSREGSNMTSYSAHVGVSAISFSLGAGTTNLNQIRREWEFTQAQPISLYREHNYIHKGRVPSNAPVL